MIADAMLFQWPLVASFSHHSVMTSRFEQSTSAIQLCLQGIGNENTGGVWEMLAKSVCLGTGDCVCVCVCIWQTVVCNEGSFVCSQECLEIIFGFRLRIIFLMIREGTVPLKFLTTQKSKPYSVCKNLLMLQENSSDVICQIFCSGKPPFSVSACFGILLADSYIILTWLHIKSQSSPTLISKQMKGGLWDKLLHTQTWQ